MAQIQETDLVARYRDYAFTRPGGTGTTNTESSPLSLYLAMKRETPHGQRFRQTLNSDRIEQAIRNNKNEAPQRLRLPRLILWALVNSREDIGPIIKANSPLRART